MKLFSTLLMSLAVSASAMAANQLKPVMAPVAKNMTAQKVLSLNDVKRAAVKPVNTDKIANLALKGAQVTTGMVKAAKKAPSAKAGVVELEFTEYAVDWEYYPSDGDWYCSVGDANDYLVKFDIVTFNSASPVGTYTTEDFDFNYAWGYHEGMQILYTEASCTVAEGENGYTIDATIVTDEGETLHVTVNPAPHEAQTINIEGAEMTMANFYTYDMDWWVAFVDAEGMARVYLDLVNPENPGDFAGTYTIDDVLANYTYVQLAGTNYPFKELNVVTTGDDPTVSCEITGSGVLTNGDVVNFHMLRLPPLQPDVHVTVDATLDFFEFNSEVYNGNSAIVAKAGDMTFQIVYTGTVGEFTQFAAGTCYVDAQGNIVAVDNGVLSVEVTSDNNIAISAELVCEDLVCYHINLTAPIEVQGSKEIICHDWEVVDLFGLIYYVIGHDDEGIEVQCSSYYYPEEGDYTADVNNYFVIYPSGAETSSLIVKSAVFTYDEAGMLQLDGSFLGQDMIDYTVHVDFTMPEIIGEMYYTSTAGEINDLSADLGIVQIIGNDENWFSVIFDMDQLTSGHYTELSSAYASYCIIVLDQYGAADQYMMYTADFDFEVNDETFTLTGTCQAGEYLWHVDLSGVVGDQPIDPQDDPRKEYDMQEDVTATFAAEDIADFEVLPEEGYAFIRVNNGTEMFSTLIYIDGDELEAGVYEINTTYAPGSAQAGDLDMNQGYVYPSFYGTLTEDGYLNVPLFLCVAGTVTVDFDAAGLPVVVADATNLWGYNAHIEVNPQGTVAIENVAAQAAKNGKFFENNAVVIRNNGQQYNAFGQIVK